MWPCVCNLICPTKFAAWGQGSVTGCIGGSGHVRDYLLRSWQISYMYISCSSNIVFSSLGIHVVTIIIFPTLEAFVYTFSCQLSRHCLYCDWFHQHQFVHSRVSSYFTLLPCLPNAECILSLLLVSLSACFDSTFSRPSRSVLKIWWVDVSSKTFT